MQLTRIVSGFDFTIRIEVVKPQYENGETVFEDFDLTACKNVKVNLVCENHKVVIPLEWRLQDNENNIILANIIGKQLHIGAVYGIEITGLDDEDKAWRFKNANVFSVVDQTKNAVMNYALIDDPLEIQAAIGLYVNAVPMRGEQGVQGEKGAQGDKGDKGLDGTFESLTPEQKEELRGYQGPIGEQGPQGEKGEQGDKGQDGTFESLTPEQKEELRGYQGAMGDTGPQGLTGPQGEIGLTGPQGEKGEQGEIGLTGPQGEIGVQGPRGEQGPQVQLNLLPCIYDPQIFSIFEENRSLYIFKLYDPNDKIVYDSLQRYVDQHNLNVTYDVSSTTDLTTQIIYIYFNRLCAFMIRFRLVNGINQNLNLSYDYLHGCITYNNLDLTAQTTIDVGVEFYSDYWGVQNIQTIQSFGFMPYYIPERREVLALSHDYSQDYLTIRTLEDNNVIYIEDDDYSTVQNTAKISYSLDNGSTWTQLSSGGGTITLSIANRTVLLKGNDLTPTSGGTIHIYSSDQVSVYGNIMSLEYGDNFVGQTSLGGKNKIFMGLFTSSINHLKIYSAVNLILPAITLTESCYASMFSSISELNIPPYILPATTLAFKCYHSMFSGCALLYTAPKLPATTLAEQCYALMFNGCNMWNMPELPATTLAEQCYAFMFNGCTGLSCIKCLATDISATDCTTNWLNGVSASGTFIKDSQMSNWTTGVNGIPQGWTIQDAHN